MPMHAARCSETTPRAALSSRGGDRKMQMAGERVLLLAILLPYAGGWRAKRCPLYVHAAGGA